MVGITVVEAEVIVNVDKRIDLDVYLLVMLLFVNMGMESIMKNYNIHYIQILTHNVSKLLYQNNIHPGQNSFYKPQKMH